MATKTAIQIKISTEVWVACALLHKNHPERDDFSIQEIMAQVREISLAGEVRPGVYVHIVQHCVAGRAPNPGRYRMLTETREGFRRLFRPNDVYHPKREGAKTKPDAEDLPRECRHLLDWYEASYKNKSTKDPAMDPILMLQGIGKEVWEGVDPDEYVRELRGDWE
jgi:hypothetical protein